jgi:hypothetical protein
MVNSQGRQPLGPEWSTKKPSFSPNGAMVPLVWQWLLSPRWGSNILFICTSLLQGLAPLAIDHRPLWGL